jgi:hypothetical protein
MRISCCRYRIETPRRRIEIAGSIVASSRLAGGNHREIRRARRSGGDLLVLSWDRGQNAQARKCGQSGVVTTATRSRPTATREAAPERDDDVALRWLRRCDQRHRG